MEKTKYVDKMTSKDRMKALILGKPIDRVPFMPFFISYFAIDNGISLYDFYTKPDVAFQAGINTLKRYPWAAIRPVYGWSDHGAWDFGGKIEWPKDVMTMNPFTPEPLISEPEDVNKLQDPNPGEIEWFRLRNQFNEICIKNGFSAMLPSASIMAQLRSILGTMNFIVWMKSDPDAFRKLAEKVFTLNMKMAKVTINRFSGERCSVMTEFALESNTLMSPEMFEEFSLPYIIKMHDFYLKNGVRATLLHLCGNHKLNMKYMKQIPLSDRAIFSISEFQDLKEVGETLGDKYIIAGNLPVNTIRNGTPEDVFRETAKCLEKGKKLSGGYILMPACEWPPHAPEGNLEAIKEAIMEYGFY